MAQAARQMQPRLALRWGRMTASAAAGASSARVKTSVPAVSTPLVVLLAWQWFASSLALAVTDPGCWLSCVPAAPAGTAQPGQTAAQPGQTALDLRTEAVSAQIQPYAAWVAQTASASWPAGGDLGCIKDTKARQDRVREAARWAWQGYKCGSCCLPGRALQHSCPVLQASTDGAASYVAALLPDPRWTKSNALQGGWHHWACTQRPWAQTRPLEAVKSGWGPLQSAPGCRLCATHSQWWPDVRTACQQA